MKKDGRGHPQEVLNKGKCVSKVQRDAQQRAIAAGARIRDFLARGTPTWGTETRKPSPLLAVAK